MTDAKRGTHPVTLKDLAARAGVTVTTVSRALNDKPDIGAETKQRIIELATGLGYAPNLLAYGLRAQKTSFIGAVIMDNANPFFAGVLRGIEDAARARAYQTVLCNTDFSVQREQEAIQLLSQLRVAGILLYPVETQPDLLRALLQPGVPVVLMGRSYEDVPTNSIVFDDALGGYLATRHALQRGYRKVAYLGGEENTSATSHRFRGYCRALAEAGNLADPSLIFWGGRGIRDGYETCRRLLAQQDPPLAAFCLNDLVAIGALQAVDEAGLGVPDDVGIIGYDDIEMASLVRVPLTTVASSHYALGRGAADLLFSVLNGEKESSAHPQVLTPHLMVRASC